MPRGVWALGFVSMFMDISSEMVQCPLPVFLATNLGASVMTLGLIEGVAQATASITKLFSGWLSDRLGKRNLPAIIGYGLGAVTKQVFPLAVTTFEVFGARFVDRVGKAIFGGVAERRHLPGADIARARATSPIGQGFVSAAECQVPSAGGGNRFSIQNGSVVDSGKWSRRFRRCFFECRRASRRWRDRELSY